MTENRVTISGKLKQEPFDKLRTACILAWLNLIRWMIQVTPVRLATFTLYIDGNKIESVEVTTFELLNMKTNDETP